jgi:hypothetical protein
MKNLWLLGAADPEMQEIEALLRSSGELVEYALDESGARVNPRTAYAVRSRSGEHRVVAPIVTYTVECYISAIGGAVTAIDHHRRGDPGFGRPPQEYFEASSIGQVVAELRRCGVDVAVTARMRAVAACDHCLGHAWAGRCPGVSRDDVRAYRAALAATRPVDPVPVEVYEARFDETLAELAELEHEYQGSPINLLGRDRMPELPDVACYMGVCYLASVADRDGRKKVVLGGATTPDAVQFFLDCTAVEMGLTGIYGDPQRGFAGGYLPQD